MNSERIEQITLINQIRRLYPGLMVFSIPNGVNCTARERSKLISEGMLAGAADLFIPKLKLFIELKRVDGGVQSPAQLKFNSYINTETDLECIFCNGYETALAAIKERISCTL